MHDAFKSLRNLSQCTCCRVCGHGRGEEGRRKSEWGMGGEGTEGRGVGSGYLYKEEGGRVESTRGGNGKGGEQVDRAGESREPGHTGI